MANFKLTQTKEQIQADLDLLDNNTATAGQVLTANGTGGASWQNASGGSGGGGGTQLYRHDIVNGDEHYIIISNRSTAYNNVNEISADTLIEFFYVCPDTGSIEKYSRALFYYFDNGNVEFEYLTPATLQLMSMTLDYIGNDNVTPL